MNYIEHKEITQLYETFPEISPFVIHDYYIQFKGNMDLIINHILLLIDQFTIHDEVISNDSSDVVVHSIVSSDSSHSLDKNQKEISNKKSYIHDKIRDNICIM